MEILKTIKEAREYTKALKREGKTLGLVPTMGYLHDGHLSLVKLSQSKADATMLYIFVNPAQFNNPEDLEKYPRDEARDLELAKAQGVDAVFMPTKEMLYPDSFQSWVETTELTKGYEGEFRPGHFRGVTTVLSIMFNIVQPDFAPFGEKDFQQLRVIEKMVEDLRFPIEVLRGKTVREADGLAMSSRNARLSEQGRKTALGISQGFAATAKAFAGGLSNRSELVELAKTVMSEDAALKIEYLDIVDENFKPVASASADSRVLAAAYVDGVRLIDNCAMGLGV